MKRERRTDPQQGYVYEKLASVAGWSMVRRVTGKGSYDAPYCLPTENWKTWRKWR